MFVYLRWANNISESSNIDPYGSLLETNTGINTILNKLRKLDDAKCVAWLKDYTDESGMIIKPVHEVIDLCMTDKINWNCVSKGMDIRDYIVKALDTQDLAVVRSHVYQITIDPSTKLGEVCIRGTVYGQN